MDTKCPIVGQSFLEMASSFNVKHSREEGGEEGGGVGGAHSKHRLNACILTFIY